MIKYINRIVLVLLAGLGLLTTYNLSEAHVISTYLNDKGEEAINEGNYTFFMPSRYYNDNILQEFTHVEGNRSFVVRIYEVARIMSDDEGLRVEDGIFLLVEQLTGEDFPYTFDVEYQAGDDIVIPYVMKKQLSLPLYASIQKQTERTIVLKNDFYDEDTESYLSLSEIRLFQDNNFIITIPVNVDFDTFVIKEQIETYLASHENNAPTEDFDAVSVTERIVPVDHDNIILRNLIIYVSIIIILTIVFFRYKNNRLGRKKATEGLQKDVAKLKENQENKR
ncbi:MAG: hypothetical protein EP317_05330 [Bacillota bacterium]|nr:MAG: hypothetical protein EP317_05330 [Bacillota bacterium]